MEIKFLSFYTLKIATFWDVGCDLHTRSAWHHIPEDGIVRSHCCGNLKFCMLYIVHFVDSMSDTLSYFERFVM